MRARSHAFTVLELTIVVGIVGVLLALLLPTISRVRSHANIVNCSSNLRQIVAAVRHRSQDCDGFGPLAGRVVISAEHARADSFPDALNDSRRRRYAYYRTQMTPMGEAVVPIQAALAKYLGARRVEHTNERELATTMQELSESLRVFRCPDILPQDRDAAPLTVMILLDGANSYSVNFLNTIDYAANEGVLGFHYSSRYSHRRCNGQLGRIANPNRVVLLTDATSGRAAQDLMGGPMYWQVELEPGGAISLADLVPGNVGAAFHRSRHRGRLNVGFIDGHVETLNIDPRSLRNALLLPS